MLRTTVFLDEETALGIRQLAEIEKRSQAEIMRDALQKHVRRALSETPKLEIPGLGAFSSGRSDVSERAEELLWEEAKGKR